MADTDVERKLALVVLDGLGITDPGPGNAFTQADTPALDRLFSDYPYTELTAAGEAVGLPAGYAGNSEVGHLHIGAGRVVPQYLTRINTAIDDGTFCDQDALRDAVEYAQTHDGTVHILGIASDGGVHGHIAHMTAVLDCLSGHDGSIDIVLHPFLDGRDVPPESAEQYLETLQEACNEHENTRIGSVMGRFYAMDRDNNWDRTREAYECLVRGVGRTAQSISGALSQAREHDDNDYFVSPTVIDPSFAPVQDGDSVVCTNYRKDRIRQLSAAFVADDFGRFSTAHGAVRFVSMTRYDASFGNPVLFDEPTIAGTLGEVLSKHGVGQLRLTESQKRPHVTYFFDGEREAPSEGVETDIVPSADVPTYDEKPEMEADTITDHAVAAMEQDNHEYILINYPNADLVGHTGDVDATVTAVETVDRCVDRLVTAAAAEGYTVVLTADHGNCEKLREDGAPFTAHTLNNVPCCIIPGDGDLASSDLQLASDGSLTNVAPTVLALFGLSVPETMEPPLTVQHR